MGSRRRFHNSAFSIDSMNKTGKGRIGCSALVPQSFEVGSHVLDHLHRRSVITGFIERGS